MTELAKLNPSLPAENAITCDRWLVWGLRVGCGRRHRGAGGSAAEEDMLGRDAVHAAIKSCTSSFAAATIMLIPKGVQGEFGRILARSLRDAGVGGLCGWAMVFGTPLVLLGAVGCKSKGGSGAKRKGSQVPDAACPPCDAVGDLTSKSVRLCRIADLRPAYSTGEKGLCTLVRPPRACSRCALSPPGSLSTKAPPPTPIPRAWQ